MKVENGEKSMKITILWKSTLVVSALLVFLFTLLGEAAPMGEAGPQVATQPLKVTTPPKATISRPFSDFLDAQGKTEPLFFPLVRNYVGWTDDKKPKHAITFALVDYVGLANDYLQGKLGTRVVGSVTQSELPNGSAQIMVDITTDNALGFAQSVPAILRNDTQFPFLNTLTIFGNKAQDVANGAEAAVGNSTFLITFSIAKPGDPLPDLVDVVVNNPKKFKPINISFIATIREKCEHGTRAVLHVDQEGAPGNNGATQIVEIVHVPCS